MRHPPLGLRPPRAEQPRAPRDQIGDQLLLDASDQLGRGSRCRRAHVRGEIRDGEVDLVANGAHRRNGTRRQRSRDDFLVERPQVFQAAASARDDEHVDSRRGGSARDRSRNLLRGAVPLHARGHDQHRQVGKPAVQHAQEIVHGRSRGARHDRDAARQERKAPLARHIEEAFRIETRLQLLEGDLQRARS